MALPPFLRRRTSTTPAPDYSTKQDVKSFLTGEKKTPDEANYRLAQPNDAKQRCHECMFYEHPGQPESSCSKVVGMVRAEGICDLFKQRDYNQDDTNGPKTSITIQVN